MNRFYGVALLVGALASFSACGGGKGGEYVDAMCACKDAKCSADTTQKYVDQMKDPSFLNDDQKKKLGDCASKMMGK
jgi:hypothetical protein